MNLRFEPKTERMIFRPVRNFVHFAEEPQFRLRVEQPSQHFFGGQTRFLRIAHEMSSTFGQVFEVNHRVANLNFNN